MPDASTQDITRARTSAPVSLDENHRSALHLLAYFLYRQSHYSEACKVAAGLVSLLPNDLRAKRILIAALIGAERYDDALRLADTYRAEPNEKSASTIHLLRAQALWRSGRGEEAREAADLFLKLRQVNE